MSVRSVSDHAGGQVGAGKLQSGRRLDNLIVRNIGINPSLLKSPDYWILAALTRGRGNLGWMETVRNIPLTNFSPAFRQVPSRYPVSGRNDDILIPEWISVAVAIPISKLPCLQISLPMIQSLG